MKTLQILKGISNHQYRMLLVFINILFIDPEPIGILNT